MLLFRVDRKELTMLVNTNPTNKYNNSSVFIDGKRRDRVTDRYIWFDSYDEAKEELAKAIANEKRSIASQIATLNAKLDALEYVLAAQCKDVKDTVTQYNNDNWG